MTINYSQARVEELEEELEAERQARSKVISYCEINTIDKFFVFF